MPIFLGVKSPEILREEFRDVFRNRSLRCRNFAHNLPCIPGSAAAQLTKAPCFSEDDTRIVVSP
jgi:hypothetical protein